MLGQSQNSALTVLIDPTFREDWDGNLWTRIRTAALSLSLTSLCSEWNVRTKRYVIISKRAWPVNDGGAFLFPQLITGVEGTSVRIATF